RILVAFAHRGAGEASTAIFVPPVLAFRTAIITELAAAVITGHRPMAALAVTIEIATLTGPHFAAPLGIPIPLVAITAEATAVLVAPVATVVPASIALVNHAVLLAAALSLVVAEPGSNLVSGALEKAALVSAAVPILVAVPITAFETLTAPSRALVTRIVPRVVTVISHTQPPWGDRRDAGQMPEGKTYGGRRPFPFETGRGRAKSVGRNPLGTSDLQGGNFAARSRLPKARGCSSDGRALQSHCRGQGFDSPQLHQPPLFRTSQNKSEP